MNFVFSILNFIKKHKSGTKLLVYLHIAILDVQTVIYFFCSIEMFKCLA